MATAVVVIPLYVPDEFRGVGPWDKETSIESFVSHWLQEGYYVGDIWVNLPEGIRYGGFKIVWEPDWAAQGYEEDE